MLTSQIPVILGGYDSQRQSFINVVKAAVGKAPVAMWFPHRNDTTVSVDPVSGRVWTAEATMATQISPQGRGSIRTFNGTSNYLSTPDTANLSFGNSTTDTAFSIFAVANVTDTAAARRILTKFTSSSAGEYAFSVAATDAANLVIADASVGGTAPTALTNGSITQGSLTTLCGTYSAATGGATAANDMVIYQNAVVQASTPTNNASYVAMEDTTELLLIGALASAAPSGFFQGLLGPVLLFPGAFTAAQVLTLHNAFRTFSQF